MSPSEFKTEFLTQLDDRVAPASAPGYNNYHISLFLTRAQEQLVKNYLDPDSNKSGDGFEMTEKRRRKLNFLLRKHSFTPTQGVTQSPIYPNSLSYDIGQLEILRIVQEHLLLSDDIKCRGSNFLKVVPVSHDDIDDAMYNPHRKPNQYQAWRIDAGSVNGTSDEYIEIASAFPYTEYRFRYIVRPKPIIVGTLPSGLTIDGQSAVQTSLLPETFHSEIVSRAVTNALARLGDPNVQSSILVETRDE